MLHYRLLGALDVRGDRRHAEPATPKMAAVLALLLCRPNEIVSTSAIIEEVWGEDAPRSAIATTQTYIYQLRKFLRDLDVAGGGDDALETRPPGYVLHVREDQVDVFGFHRLAREGRAFIEAGRPDEAIVTLLRAISMWRGPALSNVYQGRFTQAYVAQLDEALMRVRELYIEANFLVGRHRDMIGELTSLCQIHPLNEWIHSHLIKALSWAGRRADALRVYGRLRTNLAEELGIDPSPALQRLELDVLEAAAPQPTQ
jgi:DNA-binding SARP family transcriptional activator